MVSTEGRLKGFAEEGWIGKELDLGDQVRVRVEKANVRCKIVTLKQAGVEADDGILQTIQSENANNLGVMCTVAKEGILSVGAPVSLS